MRFFVILIGMAGFASVAFITWGVLGDGGLSRALFDADAALQTMSEAQRRQLLEVWSADVKLIAQSKRTPVQATVSPEKPQEAGKAPLRGKSPVPADAALDPTRPAAPQPGGAVQDLLTRYDGIQRMFDSARKVWRSDTQGLSDTLGQVKVYLEHAEQSWPTLDEAERATVQAQIAALHDDILSNFASGNAAFGRARSTDPKVDQLYKACRARYEAMQGMMR